MNFFRICLLVFSLFFVGCQTYTDVADSKAATAARPGQLAIDADSYARRVKTLASDEFEGRSPASAGEQKTIAFIRDEFKKIGLAPGNGNSWYQKVPLVEITTTSASLTLSGENQRELALGDEAIIWTKHVTDRVSLSDSQLVFVGYGIVAPEYDWNDYAGIDVRGKTVVMLVNDPGFATQDPSLFNGNAMTYYGRWTYKYEEAAKQGAAGVILIHETKPAGYPWQVVTGGWSGPQFDLVSADKNFSRSKIEGWINQDMATELFAPTGMTLDQARKKALKRGFTAMTLPWTATGQIQNTTRVLNSNNVLGLLPGTDLRDEYIIYMAHWDHLGRDDTLEGDQIFNGAVDNATGTAALMELAEAFVSSGSPRRSILFMAVTAEESGLLGSRHYGTNPVYPLAQTVAGINMDALNILGRTRDVAVIGFGSSELENYLARAATQQGRVIVPEPTPEKGFFYRSDHFNLSKQGVPMLYSKAGFDFRDGGVTRGAELSEDWVANRYHKVGDEYRDDWDLTCTIEDMQLYFSVGKELADSDVWPAWNSSSEFKAIRDASRAANR